MPRPSRIFRRSSPFPLEIDVDRALHDVVDELLDPPHSGLHVLRPLRQLPVKKGDHDDLHSQLHAEPYQNVNWHPWPFCRYARTRATVMLVPVKVWMFNRYCGPPVRENVPAGAANRSMAFWTTTQVTPPSMLTSRFAVQTLYVPVAS